MTDFPELSETREVGIMSRGKVHRYFYDKGFGFIQRDDGRLFFAHRSKVVGDDRELRREDRVHFDIIDGTHVALNIRKVAG
jgi:cold shock CspA family protein